MANCFFSFSVSNFPSSQFIDKKIPIPINSIYIKTKTRFMWIAIFNIFKKTVKPHNNGHSFCRALVTTVEGWSILRGFIYLNPTGLHSYNLVLIHGLTLVRRGGGALIRSFTVSFLHKLCSLSRE